MSTGLSARGIIVEAGPRRLLDAVDIDVIPGQLTAVIGPNGAGKSTLLKVLSGDIRPQSGTVHFDGKALYNWRSDALARQRAVLPQAPELAFHFQVGDVVALGRHPHAGHCTAATDARAINGAMAAAAVTPLAGQDCHLLSGGERHRTHYARVLAQLWDDTPTNKPRALLLDEPTAGLDLFHQHTILAKARAMAAEGVGVLAVL
ncbi:MAG: ATP-binding cassette domain-containing protein, partial [Rhizomicrobium sp.]